MGQSEVGIIDPEAAAVVERLSHLASSREFDPLDNPLVGYVLIPDPAQQSLFVILEQSNYQTRKTEFGLDMGTVTGEVLGQTPGEFTNGEWIAADIPQNMKLKARGIEFGDKRATYILEIKQIGTTTVEQVTTAMHDTFERRTAAAGMYPEISDGMIMDETDAQLLDLFGFHAGIYTHDGTPAVGIVFPIQRVITDFLTARETPRFQLEQFLRTQYPGESIVTDQENTQDHPHFPYTYARKQHFSTQSIALDDDTGHAVPTPVFRYTLPITPDTIRPLQTATRLREYMLELLAMVGMPQFDRDPDPQVQNAVSWLKQQPFTTLLEIFEQAHALSADQRIALTLKIAAAHTA